MIDLPLPSRHSRWRQLEPTRPGRQLPLQPRQPCRPASMLSVPIRSTARAARAPRLGQISRGADGSQSPGRSAGRRGEPARSSSDALARSRVNLAEARRFAQLSLSERIGR